MKKIDFKKFILCSILLGGLLIRVIALLISDNFHGIAAGKVLEAQRLLVFPSFLDSWVVPAHGPVHMYLISLVVMLFKDTILMPRLISLLSAMAFLVIYYFFISKVLDKKTALLSLFVVTFFPKHILLVFCRPLKLHFYFFFLQVCWHF